MDSLRRNGVILSFFAENGYGFIKDAENQRQYFYNLSRSPDLEMISHIGMYCTFDVAPSPRKTWGEEAINLRNV